MEIRIYDNLIEHYSEIVAWSNVRSFELDKLTLSKKGELESLNVIEVMFPGNQGNREDQRVFNLYESFVKRFLSITQTPAYLVIVEYRSKERNRIRSYKGIIPRSINKEDYIEEEVNVGNGKTLIVGIIKIRENNYEYLFDDFYNSTCFIIFSLRQIFTDKFIKELVENHVIVDKITIINYLSLILDQIGDNDIILRGAGDGGDVEVDLQIFAKKHLREYLINDINSALKP